MAHAPDSVSELVERFERHVEAYRRGGYGETEVRVEFIDPLFIALGWDVRNTAGYAEAYKDVVHEDAIKVGGSTKAPDYCFRIGGTRKFFLEAKKPSVDIAGEPTAAYQLRRYAWSAKLPLSILTDFEELAVYDCRIRPKHTDRASAARTVYLRYSDYVPKWDELASVFSKEAVLQGSFDKYVGGRKKRGTAEVDGEFLKEIDSWRGALARNIALRNPQLTTRELNFAVQRTIDRIIFLRICEDRGVEAYGALQALINGRKVYARLMQVFRSADDRYNSGLFHFNAERGRPTAPDELTPALSIDEKVLKDIFRSLYYPQSPYEFSVLPADILGNVYEQFLGKVIDLTAGHRARVEEKPEVKKAGGVYYTPKYIVDYIVEHTVGKLIQGRTPRQVSRLRILDPACGSGSFLVGAYKKLLDHHRDWYLQDGAKKHTKRVYQGAGGQWYLTTDEKKRILLNNIYGVDIDPQAIEVTKLNLLLCVLENENQSTMRQLALIHTRALPDLGDNIKCGNRLIGTDFFEGKQLALFDDETRYRINAFDWEDEFPEVFKGKNPGFDAVIGNPPYIRMEAFKEVKDYLRRNYRTHADRADIYFYFVERGISVVNREGMFGFILSNSFTRSRAGTSLRSFLSQRSEITRVVEFGDFTPFIGASVYPVIVIARKATSEERAGGIAYVLQNQDPAHQSIGDHFPVIFSFDKCSLRSDGWVFEAKSSRELRERLFSEYRPLGEQYGPPRMGIKTGLNAAFIIDGERRERILSECPEAEGIIKPYLAGRDMDTWQCRWAGEWLIYIPHGFDMKPYAPVLNHMEAFKAALRERATRQKWYELQQPQEAYSRLFVEPKIVYPDISRYPKFSLDRKGMFFSNTGYFIASGSLYLLGLLNSNLLWFVIRGLSNALRGGLWRFRLFTGHIERLPIRTIDDSNGSDRAAKDRIRELVEQMLSLAEDLAVARTDQDKRVIQRQIDRSQTLMDLLVYGLYGLSEEEIAIVEEAPR